jgi:hypothetical protein
MVTTTTHRCWSTFSVPKMWRVHLNWLALYDK